jgi:hypothetical protein
MPLSPRGGQISGCFLCYNRVRCRRLLFRFPFYDVALRASSRRYPIFLSVFTLVPGSHNVVLFLSLGANFSLFISLPAQWASTMKARAPRAAAFRADMPRGGAVEPLDITALDRLPSCAVGASCPENVLKRPT